ncbi:MAG: hypothetical protein ACFFCE_19330 [Promethearchaeota archaeon]
MTLKNEKNKILLAVILLIITFTGGLPLLISNLESAGTQLPKLSDPEITINSPVEGKTYTSSMDRYYPSTYDFDDCATKSKVYYGTYDFRDETVGDIGKNIKFIEGYSASSSCHARIVSSWKSHNKVLEIKDDNEDYQCRVYLYNYFDGYKANAAVEFWWGTSSSSNQDQLRFKLLEGSTTLVELRFWETAGKIEYCDTTWRTLKSGLSSNTWYHLKIVCDDTNNQYKVYINGQEYGSYKYRNNGASNIGPDRLYFSTLGNTGYGGYVHFIDAVGFSWDTSSHGGLGYRVGNNINPYDIEPLLEEGLNFDFTYNTYTKTTYDSEVFDNVLELVDNSGSDYWLVEDTFSAQKYGTIEYWIKISDSSQYVLNNIRTGGATMIKVFISGGKWYCQDGYTEKVIPNIPNPVDDEWHHVRVHFRCSGASDFEGLEENRWKAIIDGNEYQQNFAFFQERSKTYLNTVTFSSGSAQKNYKVYLDLLGYSWDLAYSNRGYYPAKYGFEDENPNNEGYDIRFIEGYSASSNCHAKIISSWRSHKKVLEIKDNNPAYQACVSMFNYFDGYKANAAVEFWWGTSSSSNQDQLRFKLLEGSTTLVELRFWQTAGQIDYCDTTWRKIKSGLTSDTWYHIKIVCDDTNNQYKVNIDGIEYGPYNYRNNGESNIGPDRLYFSSLGNNGYGDSDYIHYLDAVGYSWDSNYNIGDNRHEGLLLDITPNNIEASYKVDGGNWASIFGDTVIPIPENGQHTITVSASGYEDGVVNFQTRIIEEPFGGEEFQEPDDGYYLGTYSFEDENPNDEGYAINFINEYGASSGCSAKISQSYENHHKVLEIKDNNPADQARVYLCNYFDGGAKPDAQVEFWWSTYSMSHQDQLRFKLLEGSTTLVELRFWQTNGKLEYCDGDWKAIKNDLSRATWYHIKIECHDSSNEYYVYINGIPYGPYDYRTGSSTGPDRLLFSTLGDVGYGDEDYSHHIDAVGYSWDPNYAMGDNRYEGILLEVDNSGYEWMGYSYDNEPIVTIYGDKVIPCESGAHSIQLIGKHTTGAYYYSKRVYYNTPNYAKGFLYAQSTESHVILSSGSWVDEHAAITSVANPGDYLVLYTASYKVEPVENYEGYGWVKLITDQGVIQKTKRLHDCLNSGLGPDNFIYGTMIVIDVLTLGSGGVKAEISFSPEWAEDLYIYERSICAIPFENDYKYINSMNYRSWAYEDDSYPDQDIHIEGLTGEYFAIYTSSFKVNDDTTDLLGVHCNGWAFFASNSQDYNNTRRRWEFPAGLFQNEMRGTIVIADMLSLNNEDLSVKLYLDQRDDEKITIMERSMILIPLKYDYKYENRSSTTEDLNEDIVFENNNHKNFVIYTATYGLQDPDEYSQPYLVDDQAQGWGWTAFNDGNSEIVFTKRNFNFPGGYGAYFWKTKVHIEILDLYGKELKVEYNWNPSDNEWFRLYYRSMIVIPFVP